MQHRPSGGLYEGSAELSLALGGTSGDAKLTERRAKDPGARDLGWTPFMAPGSLRNAADGPREQGNSRWVEPRPLRFTSWRLPDGNSGGLHCRNPPGIERSGGSRRQERDAVPPAGSLLKSSCNAQARHPAPRLCGARWGALVLGENTRDQPFGVQARTIFAGPILVPSENFASAWARNLPLEHLASR